MDATERQDPTLVHVLALGGLLVAGLALALGTFALVLGARDSDWRLYAVVPFAYALTGLLSATGYHDLEVTRFEDALLPRLLARPFDLVARLLGRVGE